LPGYNEDINNPGRPDKATIRWNFDGGIFNGEYFDLIRVNYTDPSNSGSYASTERVCMVEYRLGSGYPGGGYGGGGGPVCVGPVKKTPWIRGSYGKCCDKKPGGAIAGEGDHLYAEFFRVSVNLCDIALNVARCKKTTYACDYVNSVDADDPCGYLVNARLQMRFEVEKALYESNNCDDVYPNASDVPTTFPSGFWTLTSSPLPTFLPVARSRVVSSLRVIPTEIELFLPYGINQKECCSEWGVPENAFGIAKPGGWNDLYLQCQANDGNFEVDINSGCRYAPYNTDCFEPPCCAGGFECYETKVLQTVNLGDWRFVGTGEPT
jgi:hypothetical protein